MSQIVVPLPNFRLCVCAQRWSGIGYFNGTGLELSTYRSKSYRCVIWRQSIWIDDGTVGTKMLSVATPSIPAGSCIPALIVNRPEI